MIRIVAVLIAIAGSVAILGAMAVVLGTWSVLAIALLLASLWGLFVLGLVAMAAWGKRIHRLFFNRMKAAGRTLPWQEVEAQLAGGRGTLIVQQTNKRCIRFWWTPDDLMAARLAPITEFESLGYGYITGRSDHSFVQMCQTGYVSPQTGQALLTHPDFQLPPGPMESSFLLARYPRARIVHTLILRTDA